MALINLGFIFFFFFIQINQVKNIFTPEYITDNKYPFVLPFSNYNYFNVLTNNKGLKINKEDGTNTFYNPLINYDKDAIYCDNKLNKSFLLYSEKLYSIYSKESISVIDISGNSNKFNYYGCITLMNDDDVFICGIKVNNGSKLAFLKKKTNNKNVEYFEYDIGNIEKVSCKFMNEDLICAMIIKEHIHFIYSSNFITDKNSKNNSFSLNYSQTDSGLYVNLALYDTTIVNIKILCKQEKEKDMKILCGFHDIKEIRELCFRNIVNNEKKERQALVNMAEIGKDEKKNLININVGQSEELEQKYLTFISNSNTFSKEDCSFSEFNNEYLFCCGIRDFIICYRLDNNYQIIRNFNISISGKNSYLSIMINKLCPIFIFMNNENKIYKYTICIPNCTNQKYSFFNSMNENRTKETKERLLNLFEIKTINTYLRFDNAPYDFGYFILNNSNDNKVIISSNIINIKNNDYIIDFIITNKEKITSQDIIIKYTVSFESDEAYSNQCQIIFNFLNISQCYHSCKTCSINIYGSSTSYHNCLECKDNYYPSPKLKTNCYTYNEKEINWYYDLSNSSFALCNMECKSCSGPSNNECTSCYNGAYLYSGHCQDKCESGYFPAIIKENDDYYYKCFACFENCETCLDKEKGNSTYMKCQTCKENYIKYKNNCYQIVNSTINSFIDPEKNNIESSCYQKFKLYIKEDSNKCIELSEKDEDYYISNNITGLLSRCHENCLSCDNGIIKDNSGKLISMECFSCKDLNDTNKSMIKFENNGFK